MAKPRMRETWLGSVPSYVVVDPIRLTLAEFEGMREAAQPDNLPAPPETLCKVRIDGKWHACDRQYSFGVAHHYARPITIIVPAAKETVECAPT